MTNYEVVPARIPANNREVEQFEAWLERISHAGGELVTTMPSAMSNMALCIFRVQTRGSLAEFKTQ
jgi:hypothetical protein